MKAEYRQNCVSFGDFRKDCFIAFSNLKMLPTPPARGFSPAVSGLEPCLLTLPFLKPLAGAGPTQVTQEPLSVARASTLSSGWSPFCHLRSFSSFSTWASLGTSATLGWFGRPGSWAVGGTALDKPQGLLPPLSASGPFFLLGRHLLSPHPGPVCQVPAPGRPGPGSSWVVGSPPLAALGLGSWGAGCWGCRDKAQTEGLHHTLNSLSLEARRPRSRWRQLLSPLLGMCVALVSCVFTLSSLQVSVSRFPPVRTLVRIRVSSISS